MCFHQLLSGGWKKTHKVGSVTPGNVSNVGAKRGGGRMHTKREKEIIKFSFLSPLPKIWEKNKLRLKSNPLIVFFFFFSLWDELGRT